MQSSVIPPMSKPNKIFGREWPENMQNHIIENLQYIADDELDEREWDALFSKTQDALATAAQHAKEQILEGKATPMDYQRL